MAVAFPFSVITSKPGASINKLQTQLNKVIDKLNKKVTEAISKSGKLPTNINCNDPRILEIKRVLSQIQKYIDQIRTISLMLSSKPESSSNTGSITNNKKCKINNEVVNDNITSEFYRLINVSQSDLE
jgi:septal ring factor EnvC (AmiA/AmiB activator)